MTAAPAALAVAAVVLVAGSGRSTASLRLRRVAGPRPGPAAGSPEGRSSRGSVLAGVSGRRCAALATGVCCLVVVGGWPGLVTGAVAGVATERALARLPDQGSARERAEAARDLPLALDLLACVLRAGHPPSSASAAVASAVGGPVGVALASVASASVLGAPAQQAWQPVERLAGAAATARTMARAAHSGTALADELGRSAEALRVARAAAAEARIRRAAVLVVLPLGLCFLPAFICVGVLPLVAGVAGSALR